MKKQFFFIIAIAIIPIIMLGCSMSSTLPTGEFIKEVYSPDKTYVVKAYVCLYNATTPNAVRCEVEEVSSGKIRDIYWQNRKNDVEIEWINNTVVSIDDIKLNIQNNEYYDYREHYSLDDDLEYWEKYWGINE